MGTFHSTCVQILRRHAEEIGLPRDFTIFDTTDQLTVIRDALQALNIDSKQFDPRGVRAGISHAKNERIDPETYATRASDHRERQLAKLYAAYEERMREAKA